MQLGVIVGLIFGVLIAFFAFLNTAVITVNYYFGQVDASVALVVLASAMAGALAVGLFGLITHIRTGFAMWDYKNKLGRLAKEVEDLREQKKALNDDLSFLHAECEQAVRQKGTELDDCHNGVDEESHPDGGQEAEEKRTDDI